MTAKLLDQIDGPADLKGLDDEQLVQVAQEVRELIIDTIGEIGGHFGANLGACEIAVALHSLLDSPADKVLWDVGHQAYPHKVLTGRRDELHTIRKYGGLAPFCSIAESEHDIMGAGHASTSVSYAVGIKEAMRRGTAPDGKVVAVIGDGALTGGVAFEALLNAGGMDLPIVIVVNDNGMSIAPNVGALSRYFNRMRLNPKLYHAREDVEDDAHAPAGRHRRAHRAARADPQGVAQGVLGARAVLRGARPRVRRRDRRPRREGAARARSARRSRPTARSSCTARPSRARASSRPRRAASRAWRSGTPPSPARSSNGAVAEAPAPARSAARSPAPPQYTTVFGEALVEECRRDERVVGITAAMNSGTGLNILQKALPERYYDVGIAEQHAVLFAAGLALEGAKPVAAIYSTFLQRALRPDRPRRLPAEPQRRVRDGPRRARRRRRPDPPRRLRHLLHALPAEPGADGAARRGDARPHAAHRRQLRRRPDRAALPARRGGGRAAAAPAGARSRSAAASCCARASAWRCSATATGCRVALGAADLLADEHGVEPTVADARFAKPLDGELIERLVAEHDLIVTIEENVLPAASARRVLEHLADARPARRRARAARRAARPLRDARQARAAARGGRAHAGRRGGPGGPGGARAPRAACAGLAYQRAASCPPRAAAPSPRSPRSWPPRRPARPSRPASACSAAGSTPPRWALRCGSCGRRRRRCRWRCRRPRSCTRCRPTRRRRRAGRSAAG